CAVVGMVTIGTAGSARAVDDGATVAKIGDRTVTAAQLKKALAGVPSFELAALGSSKTAILQKYLDEAIVREELLAQAAKKKGALDDRSVQLAVNKSLAGALVRKEIGALGGKEAITADEIKAYYEAHSNEYKSPERVRIWHIVTADKATAEAALAKVKADPTREGWPKIVSETSLDPNTKMSSGDLGFVSADAKTTEPKAVVPKEVATAAFALKDGEISAAPVQSTAGWHVIWRKGSVPPITRSLESETPTIRQLLWEQKRESTYKTLVERLRGTTKVEIDEELLPLPSVDVGPRPIPRQPKK
ncbi:MAG: peptidylprolyl isomerase, partial [Polyangiales bacterium]